MNTFRPRRRGRASVLILSCVGFLAALVTAQAARTELDLGGGWQYQKVSQLTYPPTNTWLALEVPSFLSGWQYEHAWFRRSFTVPAAMAGSQLKLRFGGVKYNAQVWLNGTFVGSYLNGYNPFEVDLTDTARINQTNELLIGVTDWTATFAAPVDFSTLAPYENPRDHAKNAILAPIGGRYELYGIWQPVKLVSLPPVYIADALVISSVRTQQLTVRLALRNESSLSQVVNLTNRVLEGAGSALVLSDRQITLPPLTNVQVDVTAPWASPHLWSTTDPHLYSLESTLSSDFGDDQLVTRFGFREFWAQGGNFYLNGVPIHLLATATWPPTDLQTTNQIRRVLSDVKAGNNVAIRFHTQPWDEPWYDVADELGLLVVEECAVWCDPFSYRLSDSTFWTNYAQHLAASVQRDRNHPSIVLWSLENEILHCGGERAFSATDVQLAAMGRLVKSLDPTRPITYEADLDPGGVADALGLHYPHEFPDYQVWPNSAYWLNQPIPRDWVPGGQWKWDRSKPLYIGEFLWVPSTSAADFTILFGDDAYADPGYYRNQAKGLTWQMQVEAYRSAGVNGISPWTLFEDPAASSSPFDLNPASNYLYQVQKAAYHPNAVVVQEYNNHFFAGQPVERLVHAYNDRLSSDNFTLRWSAGSGPWQTQTFGLPPAGQWTNTISFQAPTGIGGFPLHIELSDSTNVVFTNTLSYSAFPSPSLALPPGLNVGLYDPAGTTAALFHRFGLPYLAVTNMSTADYDRFNLLIVGGNSLTNETVPEIGATTIAAQWQALAMRGGWVVVLEQTNYPGWMPAGLSLQNSDASFAFPNLTHPITQDLTPEDLRWWAPDHRVVARSVVIPPNGNFRVVSGVGSRSGLEYGAALELPLGAGGMLCSQWLLIERFDVEPLAGMLLQRLLNYCAAPSGHLHARPAALLAEPTSLAAGRLAQLGLLAENFSGRITNCDPALYPVLVIAGGNAAWQEARLQLAALTAYVENGGTLIIHRPDNAFLGAAQPQLFPGLDSTDADLGLVLRRDNPAPAARLSNHDLYWIEQAGDWNRPELLSTNVAHRFYHKQFNLTNFSTIQVVNMPIHSTGGAASGGWWLYSNGYVGQDINAAQSGTHLFSVSASGTPVQGGWPQLSLRIDGHAQDTVTVANTQLAAYSLSADLTQGHHLLTLSFDNDAYAPPEDRNLFLSQIRWGRAQENDPVSLLTQPGAVAQVRRGKGLIVLDEVAWETESKNALKAGRFASELLTGLGAEFRLSSALGIPVVNMSNVNVSAYSASGGIAYLNSNGRIETPVKFATSGTYTFQIVAGGTSAQGVFPQVGIVLDGVTRTTFFLTNTAMSAYSIVLAVTAGTHKVGLTFLNDFYAPPEDRNAAFSQLNIDRPAPPRITSVNTDAVQHLVALQWEGVPGVTYRVQISTNLTDTFQSVADVTNQSSVASWQDRGGSWGPAPLSRDAPTRYYRLQ